jgi:hypothetical protein
MKALIPASLVLAMFGWAGVAQAAPQAEAAVRGKTVTAMLEGTAEVPKPGDTDGAGSFAAQVDPASGKFCYNLKVTQISAATAAALHKGPDGQAGAEMIPLRAPTESGEVSGCTRVDPALAREIIDNPGNYYVNVRNAEFADGAIRGQLTEG